MTGFKGYDTATLRTVRENLLRGLDGLVPHVHAGTLDTVPDDGHTPPAASGWLMVALLAQVNAELRSRGDSASGVVSCPELGRA